jgi:O-antigen ligase
MPRQTLLGALVRSIRNLTSSEMLFLLFVFAGDFKAMPALSWFPVDLTLFLFVISVGAVFFVKFTRAIFSLEHECIILFLIFMGWSFISVLWSSFAAANLTKATYSAVLISWSFFGAYVLGAQNWIRVRRLLTAFIIVSIVLLVYWAYTRFVLNTGDFETIEDVNDYMAYGEKAQFIMAVLIGVCIASPSNTCSLASASGIVALLVLLLFIGHRGALLLSFLMVPMALAFLLLNQRARRYRNRILPVLLGLLLAVGLLKLLVVWAGSDLVRHLGEYMTTLERLEMAYYEPEFGHSMAGRIHAQVFAYNRWLEAPIIGWGIGEFTLMYPPYEDPHNLFLEVLMEEGLVGCCLLVALMSLGLVRAWQLWPADRPDWAAIALVLWFVSLLVSFATIEGNLPNDRELFAFLGVVLGLGRRARIEAFRFGADFLRSRSDPRRALEI